MFYLFLFLSRMICSKSDRTNLAVYKKTKTTLKVTVSYSFIHTDAPPQVVFFGCSLPFIFSQLLASTTWLN